MLAAHIVLVTGLRPRPAALRTAPPRPTVLRASAAEDLQQPLFEPRDAVTLGYLTFGAAFTAINVAGRYDGYEQWLAAALACGCTSTAAMAVDAVAPPPLPSIDGPGYVSRATITRFGAAYGAASMWVCWRTGPFWPNEGAALLHDLDPALNLLAAAVFAYGLAAPLAELASSQVRALTHSDRVCIRVPVPDHTRRPLHKHVHVHAHVHVTPAKSHV